MWIIILNILSILTYLICITNGENNYLFEFLDKPFHKPCEKYPDNFIDRLFDLSNMQMEQTPDDILIFKGYVILKTAVPTPTPLQIEIFKKERGTWQLTHMSVKRPDFCTAAISKYETWHSFLKSTPEEQQKCPITEGQRIDCDISESSVFSIPMRNAEGEYNIHVEIGSKSSDLFICADVFTMLHKV